MCFPLSAAVHLEDAKRNSRHSQTLCLMLLVLPLSAQTNASVRNRLNIAVLALHLHLAEHKLYSSASVLAHETGQLPL
jgi:hypothetical protein